GEFFREWDWSCDCNFSPNGDVTQAENVVRGLEARGVVEPINYESAIALSRFDKGQLQEVRVYPVWGRHDGPLSRRGLPTTAPPEIARRILTRLQSLSEPFGTTIAIEGNIGVIRPAARTSTSAPQRCPSSRQSFSGGLTRRGRTPRRSGRAPPAVCRGSSPGTWSSTGSRRRSDGSSAPRPTSRTTRSIGTCRRARAD